MNKQLVNYKAKKEKIEDYQCLVLYPDREVLLGLPICAIDFGRYYENPVLYGDYKGIPTVYEASEVIEILKKLKTFHLKNNNGNLTEVNEKEADIHVKLPIDTRVDQLGYDNGQLYWAKPVEGKGTTEDGNN